MIRVTNRQIAAFLGASEKFSDVALDDHRGDAHAQIFAEATVKHLAYQYRAKSLEKERAKLLNDHAQKTARGEIKYGESPDGKVESRPVLLKDPTKADAAFAVWSAKMEALNDQMIDLTVAPLRDDFFAKPAEVEVKQGVRIGFLPFQAKYQGALKSTKPTAKKKR